MTWHIAIELYFLCGIAWAFAVVTAEAELRANDQPPVKVTHGWKMVARAIVFLLVITFWPLTVVFEVVRGEG